MLVAGSLLMPSPAIAATATVTSLSADDTTFSYRTEVRYTVRVRPIPDGGVAVLKIRDFDGDVVVYLSRAVNLDTGNATFYVKMGYELPPADYTVTATFLGTQNYSPSASDPLSVTLKPNTTSTVLKISPGGDYEVFVPGASVQLWARVNHTDRGTVRFYDVSTGTPSFLGDDTLTFVPNGDYAYASLRLDDVSGGTHTFLADFGGSVVGKPSADTATRDFVWGVSIDMDLASPSPNPVQDNHDTTFTVYFDAPRTGDVDPTGMVNLVNLTSGRVVASVPVPNFRREITIEAPKVGQFTYRAEYAGDAHFLPAVSNERTLRVTADIVEADAWTPTGIFWPAPKDGIADYFTVGGYRFESVRVEIRVYSPAGPLIREKLITFGREYYSWQWNGRSEDGLVLPEGEYRVVQELHDREGNELVVEGSVQLEHGVPT